MPADKINFYENQQEASMRLRKTIVMYDNEPYVVAGISDHKGDGKLRIYLDKMDYDGTTYHRLRGAPNYWDYHHTELGQKLDLWIEQNPDKGIYRKYLGAAGFNKFRPFPLGNVNIDGRVVYVERTPARNTFQGLRSDAMVCQLVSISPSNSTGKKQLYSQSSYGRGNLYPVDIYSPAFYDCLIGNYPTFEQVIAGLTDPEITNTGVAFHREFSVLRGPLGMLFLCYKTEGVGQITGNSNLILSRDFVYLKESLEELNIFRNIFIQE